MHTSGASELVGWAAAGLVQKSEKFKLSKKAILLLSKYIVLDHFGAWRPRVPFWVPERVPAKCVIIDFESKYVAKVCNNRFRLKICRKSV